VPVPVLIATEPVGVNDPVLVSEEPLNVGWLTEPAGW
jgi:hypothetical protein